MRAAFGGHIPGFSKAKAREWAHETPNLKDLPDRAPAEKGKPTLRSKKAKSEAAEPARAAEATRVYEGRRFVGEAEPRGLGGPQEYDISPEKIAMRLPTRALLGAGLGAIPGAITGAAIDKNDRLRGALVGGGVGSVAGAGGATALHAFLERSPGSIPLTTFVQGATRGQRGTVTLDGVPGADDAVAALHRPFRGGGPDTRAGREVALETSSAKVREPDPAPGQAGRIRNIAVRGDAHKHDFEAALVRGATQPENYIAPLKRMSAGQRALLEEARKPWYARDPAFTRADQFGKKHASYKLQGERKFRGLDVAIENKKGSKRYWHDPHGKERGSTLMHADYGYIRLTEGTDGDHVDVYLGPNEQAEEVYIIDQMKKPDFKEFDEQKCMLGFDSAEAAKALYLKQYDNPKFFGKMKAMPFEEFKMKVLDKSNHGKKIAFTALTGAKTADLGLADRVDDVGIGMLAIPSALALARPASGQIMRAGRALAHALPSSSMAQGVGQAMRQAGARGFALAGKAEHALAGAPHHALELGGLALVAPSIAHGVAHKIEPKTEKAEEKTAGFWPFGRKAVPAPSSGSQIVLPSDLIEGYSHFNLPTGDILAVHDDVLQDFYNAPGKSFQDQLNHVKAHHGTKVHILSSTKTAAPLAMLAGRVLGAGERGLARAGTAVTRAGTAATEGAHALAEGVQGRIADAAVRGRVGLQAGRMGLPQTHVDQAVNLERYKRTLGNAGAQHERLGISALPNTPPPVPATAPVPRMQVPPGAPPVPAAAPGGPTSAVPGGTSTLHRIRNALPLVALGGVGAVGLGGMALASGAQRAHEFLAPPEGPMSIERVAPQKGIPAY